MIAYDITNAVNRQKMACVMPFAMAQRHQHTIIRSTARPYRIPSRPMSLHPIHLLLATIGWIPFPQNYVFFISFIRSLHTYFWCFESFTRRTTSHLCVPSVYGHSVIINDANNRMPSWLALLQPHLLLCHCR